MKVKRNDMFLIGGLFFVALCFLIGTLLLRGNTTEPEAVVLIDGEEYGRYPLSEDCVIKIPGKLGDNTLTIQDGVACMSEAVCPDKICMHRGKIHYNKQQIVCAPGGIVVIIENGETSELDAIVQ